jgi:uncharacterized protein YdhG (YjbR/CyaY superfamily)
MATTQTKSAGLSDAEKAAARERVREVKAEQKRGADREAGLADLMAKVADMPEPDRSMAQRIHEIVTQTAPQLSPKTYYGMPAYANADGKVVCFFKPASKFKERYSTFGFEGAAHLDDGNMWPTSFALTKLTAADEARIAEVVKKAAH